MGSFHSGARMGNHRGIPMVAKRSNIYTRSRYWPSYRCWDHRNARISTSFDQWTDKNGCWRLFGEARYRQGEGRRQRRVLRSHLSEMMLGILFVLIALFICSFSVFVLPSYTSTPFELRRIPLRAYNWEIWEILWSVDAGYHVHVLCSGPYVVKFTLYGICYGAEPVRPWP